MRLLLENGADANLIDKDGDTAFGLALSDGHTDILRLLEPHIMSTKIQSRVRGRQTRRKAKTQNFTVGVTFGATRTASFQHAKTKNRLDIPLGDGSVYTFAKQVNVDWMHGIVQEPEVKKEGRISIILWGKNNQVL